MIKKKKTGSGTDTVIVTVTVLVADITVTVIITAIITASVTVTDIDTVTVKNNILLRTGIDIVLLLRSTTVSVAGTVTDAVTANVIVTEYGYRCRQGHHSYLQRKFYGLG